MKLLHQKTRKASKFVQDDFISNMPDNVVSNILDRLSLQDAVRTGILSRNWRFKWTMISQLIFDKNFFKFLVKTKNKKNYGRIISRLLLHLKGTITKFVLYIDVRIKLDDEDINHQILFLSTKGIKDLTICNDSGPTLKLPTHLFSCLELKHLELDNCCFDPPAEFNGFPKLLSLEFTMVHFKISKFVKFIDQCSSLEILNIQYALVDNLIMNIPFQGKLKLAKIAKLTNLKMLSLSLCDFDYKEIRDSSVVFELVRSLPELQELDLDFVNCKFTEDDGKTRSHAAFPCLNALKLTRIDLTNDIMLSCALELIRSSPNLQTLEITAFECDDEMLPATVEVDYHKMTQLQLQSVVFMDLKGSKNEVRLIKYLLACSPFLKKIVIRPHSLLASGEKLFSRKLLRLQRASPVAEIELI